MCRRPFLSLPMGCVVLAATLTGCGQQNTDAAIASPTTVASAAVGACKLLDHKEVQAVFPDAGAGVADDSRKQYGISACFWRTSRGTVAAQFWSADGSSAKDEAAGLMLGALDPLKGPAARNNVRYENLAGIGEQAVAVVETRDEQRGVIDDFAMLVAQRGGQILVLTAPELARSDRATALAQLSALGKSAVNRL